MSNNMIKCNKYKGINLEICDMLIAGSDRGGFWIRESYLTYSDIQLMTGRASELRFF